jgi:hypothetical protein
LRDKQKLQKPEFFSDQVGGRPHIRTWVRAHALLMWSLTACTCYLVGCPGIASCL